VTRVNSQSDSTVMIVLVMLYISDHDVPYLYSSAGICIGQCSTTHS